MSNYKALQEMLAAIQQREENRLRQVREKKALLNELIEKREVLELTGDQGGIDHQIETITAELKQLELLAGTHKTEQEKLQLIRKNKKISGTAYAVYEENTEILNKLAFKVNAEVEKLEELKQKYLEIIARIGAIEKESLKYVSELKTAYRYTDFDLKYYTGVCNSNIFNPITKTGSIMFDNTAVKNTFEKGAL